MHSSFYTQVPFKGLKSDHTYGQTFGFIGSCFGEHIYEKFRYYAFDSWQVPFGTVYNPISIVNQIVNIIDLDDKFTVFENKSQCFSWDTAHTIIGSNPKLLAKTLEELQVKANFTLKKTKTLFITFGSAWAYRRLEDGNIVANCHKMPSQLFSKELLSVESMYFEFERMIGLLKKLNPEIEVIITVSPVRHIKDGFPENSRSKSRLIELCHRIQDHGMAIYLPVYEMVLDELRDYRFFERDGLHPNSLTVDAVWDRLASVLFENSVPKVFPKIDAIRKMELHIPIQMTVQEIEHLKDLKDQRKALIEKEYPVLW